MPRLRQVADIERAVLKKARDAWHMFTIMAEFIGSPERLPALRPAVPIFASARVETAAPHYLLCTDIAPTVQCLFRGGF
jgi:hypothetical protein